MSYHPYPKRNLAKNYFPVPNELYHLGLSAGAIAIYGYLLHIEDRQTYQCYASYKTIGKAVKMSANTVRKYVMELEERRLIHTERTMIRTRDGRPRNGTLLYNIRPIQEAVDYFHERQMEQLELDTERQQAADRMAQHSHKHPQEPLCTASADEANPIPPPQKRANLRRFQRTLGGRKKKQDKSVASQVTLPLVTSAHSAGSYGSFSGNRKWGQNQRGDITSAVVFPESLLPQRKDRGHSGHMPGFHRV